MSDPIYALFAVWSVLLGTVLGSFWNVAIARWPQDRSVVVPRSHCPRCNTMVAARDNIPVLSWALLRGKCRSCAWPIPITYPLVEILGGLLGFLVFRRFVPDGLDLDVAHVAAAVLYFGFVSAMCIATFVDVRHYIIPDEVSVYAIPVGLLGCAGLELLGYDGWMAVGWRGSVLGALAGGAGLGAVAACGYFVSGREVLGVGDVKLMAMIGAFTGFHPSIFVILFATSFSASIVGLAVTLAKQRRVYLPLGPALAGWSIVYVLYADVLLQRMSPVLYGWLTSPATYSALP